MQRKGTGQFIDGRSTLHLLLRGKGGTDLEGGRGVSGDIEHVGPGHGGLHLLLRRGIGLAGQSQRLAGLDGVGVERPHVEDEHAGLISRADDDPARLQKARNGMVVAEPRLADKHVDAATAQIDVAWCRRSRCRSGRQVGRLSHRWRRGADDDQAQRYQCYGRRVLHGITPI